MTASTVFPSTPGVLVDRLWAPPSERTRAVLRQATLIVGFALFTAGFAQIQIHLGFTPVPITGQTLAVLVSGAALGWRSGAASQALYFAFGLVGLPFYAGGEGGWTAGTGTTFGYLMGFIVAAGLVGYLAERRQDRNLATSFSAMAAGAVTIYVFGAGYLAWKLNVPVANGETNAISLGVTPFLIGDFVKLILAGALLPAAWSLADRKR